MDELLSAIFGIFTPATIVLCVVIYFLVLMQRKIIELILSKVYPKALEKGTFANKIWGDIFLPAGSPGTGLWFTWIISSYPYPEIFASVPSGRIVFGLFCGLVSALVYKMVKGSLKGVVSKILEKFKNSANTTENSESDKNSPDSI